MGFLWQEPATSWQMGKTQGVLCRVGDGECRSGDRRWEWAGEVRVHISLKTALG